MFIYGSAGLPVPHSSKDAGLTHNHWVVCPQTTKPKTQICVPFALLYASQVVDLVDNYYFVQIIVLIRMVS